MREVRGAEPARFVDLSEEDLLGRPVQGAPLLDVPLQGAELAIGEAAGIGALQPGEHGLGLQAGIEGQLLFDLRPDIGERVGAGSPGMGHAHLAGQLAEPAILACGLGVDAGLGRRLFSRPAELVEATEAVHLLVGDNPKPP